MVENKVVIITGAANEVGKAIAIALASKGAKLTIADMDKKKLEAVAGDIKSAGKDIIVAECDPKDFGQVENVVKETMDKFGKIDALINIPQANKLSLFVDVTEELWDEIINTNLKGTFYYCKAIVPIMKNQESGRIINVVSTAGYTGSMTKGATKDVPYCTSQAALLGFTRTISAEVGTKNITANAVLIGAFDYASLRETYPADIIETGASLTTIGRVGKPEDVVGPVLFLLSDESAFVNGETMCVCGGAYMR